MTEHSHEGIRRLFDLVLDVPSAQRASVLDRECAGDDGLKQRILAMTEAAEDDRFLADATAGAMHGSSSAAATVAAPPREQVGEQIGRYKLLEQIGEGGFGVVWAAEQREPVKRRVALKIIKLGMDTKQVIARFEAERQALAMMDHPNIAKVLDAGSTETGRPYFVMELVKGVPILDYCDTEKLDTRARLDLFTKVCHAIQHAHQKGIIHRDIKPSNVLITLHDGVPVPKVIDFGIAKATNQELTSKTIYTEHRQMVGTPAYMSPEQAEMSGLDIDTRSDVYSLGVLLYEILTGTTPFNHEDLVGAGFEGMMRMIREVEPHKPSTRLSSLGDTATQAAQQRRSDVQKLGLLLRGDLDWIVMKCLEKDRTRRYETASGLATDIARHLADEPVLAGPPGARYKLAKFVKRNRGQVIAGGVVAAALVLGIIGTSIGMAWALNERSRANDEATRANLAATAEADARRAAQRSAAESREQRDAARDVVNDIMVTLTEELRHDAEADGGWLQADIAVTSEPGSETAALGVASGVLIDQFVAARRDARAEAERAHRRTAELEIVVRFFERLLASTSTLDGPSALGKPPAEQTLDDFFRLALDRAQTELKGAPRARIRVELNLRGALAGRGDIESSVRAMLDVLTKADEVLGAADPAFGRLALETAALAPYYDGRERAAELLSAALAAGAYSGDPAGRARALALLGNLTNDDELLNRAIVDARALGEDGIGTLTYALTYANRYDEAIDLADRLHVTTPGSAIAWFAKAMELERVGDLDASADAMDRCVDGYRRLWGDRHEWVLRNQHISTSLRAHAALRRDDSATAFRLAGEAIELWDRETTIAYHWNPMLPRIEAARRLGDAESAGDTLIELVVLAELIQREVDLDDLVDECMEQLGAMCDLQELKAIVERFEPTPQRDRALEALDRVSAEQE